MSEETKEWLTLNWLTLVGTGLSILGVFITLTQVLKLKSQNELTKKAIEETTKKVESIVAIVNLSRCVELIDTIQENIRNEKYEIAHLRMKDLQDNIIEILEISILPEDDKIIINLRSHQRKLTTDRFEIQKCLIDPQGTSLKKEVLINNLNQMFETLLILKSKQKHQKNGE